MTDLSTRSEGSNEYIPAVYHLVRYRFSCSGGGGDHPTGSAVANHVSTAVEDLLQRQWERLLNDVIVCEDLQRCVILNLKIK